MTCADGNLRLESGNRGLVSVASEERVAEAAK